MAFTAIAVPIVIVAVAAFVYFQRGREAQYNLHIDAARNAAALAETKTEPLEQRLAWQTTLLHLDNAELYLSSDESQELRTQAQGVVDTLDAIERLDFRPILIDQLDEDTNITRLIARNDGIYMLNGSDGVVGRAVVSVVVRHAGAERQPTTELEQQCRDEPRVVAHPAVVEAAAIGVPHEVKGSALVVYCVLIDDYPPGDELGGELKDSIASSLGKPLTPERILFIDDLPKTRNAKVMRRMVRAAHLGLDPGDTSSLVNPEAITAIKKAA